VDGPLTSDEKGIYFSYTPDPLAPTNLFPLSVSSLQCLCYPVFLSVFSLNNAVALQVRWQFLVQMFLFLLKRLQPESTKSGPVRTDR
jgi:hypothetical protein